MIEIVSTGRKLKDAIDNGLKQLGKNLEEVEVEILDNGGLFRKAKVKIRVEGEREAISVSEIKIQPAKQNVEREEVKRERPTKYSEEAKRERPAKQIEEVKRERPGKERFEHKRESKYDGTKKERKEHKDNKALIKEVKAQPVAEKLEKREPRRYEPVTEEVANKAYAFVVELVTKMGVEAEVTKSIEEGELKINLTASSSALIGYHGEVLDSIEYLTSYVINRESDKFYHVVINCNGYREKRKESLVALANKMAAKCIKVRHKIVLEPMNSTERKIIHSALSDNDQIITRSEGHEPNRHIVILCKKR